MRGVYANWVSERILPSGSANQAIFVPSGVVHLMELQEQGWSYVKP